MKWIKTQPSKVARCGNRDRRPGAAVDEVRKRWFTDQPLVNPTPAFGQSLTSR